MYFLQGNKDNDILMTIDDWSANISTINWVVSSKVRKENEVRRQSEGIGVRIISPYQANKYEMQVVERFSEISGAKWIWWRSSRKASSLVIVVRAVGGGNLEFGGGVTLQETKVSMVRPSLFVDQLTESPKTRKDSVNKCSYTLRGELENSRTTK
jgi:hypothetical protein